MRDQLQKAINLAKKTGDRLIVFDSSKPDDVFVVMSLKDYENMVLGRSEVRGLTEDELLDKINRDIAIWKTEQKEEKNIDNAIGNFTDYRDYAAESPVRTENTAREEKKANNNWWSIPSRRKVNAEEIIEEDRQYLEDVAF